MKIGDASGVLAEEAAPSTMYVMSSFFFSSFAWPALGGNQFGGVFQVRQVRFRGKRAVIFLRGRREEGGKKQRNNSAKHS